MGALALSHAREASRPYELFVSSLTANGPFGPEARL